ncbi:hypothetical protein BDV98DRAFT_560866 [Pterulicium gracile]|uniref:Uncharacterized protein n=1 Tax=Pterulicium gracile TaxID=1884261 RepID=A0A5C3QZG4_9AGAR|nr:hypothetical protein BDV98DRAFT_560866 [Pterula gracilis]
MCVSQVRLRSPPFQRSPATTSRYFWANVEVCCCERAFIAAGLQGCFLAGLDFMQA